MSKPARVPVMVAPFRLDTLEKREASAPPVGSPGSRRERRLGSGPPRPKRERRQRRQRRNRDGPPIRVPQVKLNGRLIAVLGLVLALVLVSLAYVQLSAPVQAATVKPTMGTTVLVPQSTVTLPWAPNGQSAIAVPSIGIDVRSAAETPEPVASLTKMMTAYVILHDHPLALGQNGPNITITQAEVDDYNADTTLDEANAQVSLGEVLTELQLMGGMLVHSANNYADTLALWDAGSIPAFVAKMNRTAAALGMSQTHFADPSGYDQASQSTPADLLKVAVPDMANPVFASLVRLSSITLPLAGTVSTYTPILGVQGTIGVKSGFTTAAGGGDVLAAVRRVHGLPVLILAAVTGQTGVNVLGQAGLLALNLVNSVAKVIGATPMVRSGDVVAHVVSSGSTANATARGTGNLLSWPGVRAHRKLVVSGKIHQGTKRGTRIGSMVLTVGTQHVVIPVRLSQNVGKQTFMQRLF
jgi:D-alanyl-D-alanine carboxypeptidase (penicillin-binding protein 5/6)